MGTVLVLNNFYFQLFDADEYCYKFMESNPAMFPNSSSSNALSHLRSLMSADTLPALSANLARGDTYNNGLISFNPFYSGVREIVGKFNQICVIFKCFELIFSF